MSHRIWAPDRRLLTAGLIALVTAAAFEGMAVPTVMPALVDELEGLELYGWTFSAFWLTNIIGLCVLVLWIPLRQRPGIGTVLNILLIGPSIELGLWFIQTPPELWQRILLFAGGLLLLAVASGLYIGSHFGPGPRDGLMTGIHSRTGWPIWVGRTMVEVTVLAVGWLLGGDVGFGTVAFAVLIGPLCGFTLPWLAAPKPLKRMPPVEATGTRAAAEASATT